MTHDILHRPLSELTNISFSCACGHEHRIQIGTLAVGPGASSQVAGAAGPMPRGVFCLLQMCIHSKYLASPFWSS